MTDLQLSNFIEEFVSNLENLFAKMDITYDFVFARQVISSGLEEVENKISHLNEKDQKVQRLLYSREYFFYFNSSMLKQFEIMFGYELLTSDEIQEILLKSNKLQ